MKGTAGVTKVPRFVHAIIDNAESIFSYTEGMELSAFKQNEKSKMRSNAALDEVAKRFQGQEFSVEPNACRQAYP